MTSSPGPATATEPTLSETVRDLLAKSPTPLKLSELVARLPKPLRPRKVRGQPAPAAIDYGATVREALDDEARAGRVFRHPSGPQGAERYWDRDEKRAVQEAAVAAATVPKTLAQLKTAAGGSARGAAVGFLDGAIRDLIGEGLLFEHPPRTKAGGPLFAKYAPPPPLPTLERANFKTKVDTLFTNFERLRAGASVSAEELFAALRARLQPGATAPPAVTVGAKLDELILRLVANAGPGSVLSLAELRQQMPVEYQGRVFGEAVLRLAGEERVRVYQDSDPAALSAQERADYVDDGHGHVFKTIARKG